MPSRSIDDLHPLLKPLCQEFLDRCADEGIRALLTCTYRSPKEQDSIYAQGRTKPGKKVTNAKGGQSKHNFEIHGKPAAKAFDIAIKGPNNTLNWDTASPEWKRVGRIGKSLGLVWGGDWQKLKDYPHFELASPDNQPT